MRKDKVLKFNFIVLIVMYMLLIILNRQSYGASINMSISKTSAYVGDSFTVTLSGINGKLTISGSSNISLDISGTVFVEGSLTINGKANAVGTGTVTITPIDVTTIDADPVEIKTGASRSINITEKPAEPQQPAPQTNNQSNNSSNKNTSTTKTNNNKTTSKTNTQNKPEETTIPEEATPQFGVYGLTISGVKENGEEAELSFTPEFNINVLEYNMEVENDIVDLKITPYADPYSEFVSVEKPDKLNVGENEILIKIANNENNITYKIKVIRKESPISVTGENDELDDIDANMQVGPKTVTMPVWLFTLIILSIIIIEAIILKWDFIINWVKRKKYYDVR